MSARKECKQLPQCATPYRRIEWPRILSVRRWRDRVPSHRTRTATRLRTGTRLRRMRPRTADSHELAAISHDDARQKRIGPGSCSAWSRADSSRDADFRGLNSGETSPNAVSGECHHTPLLVQVGRQTSFPIQDNSMKRRTLALWKGSPEKVEG